MSKVKRGDLLLLELSLTFTNEEILDKMRAAKSWRETFQPSNVMALIAGFDDDPRELYQIPEVRAFCKRLIDQGFISYLDLWPTIEHDMPALGAIEIIAIAECRGIEPAVVRQQFDEHYIPIVRQANATADAILGRLE